MRGKLPLVTLALLGLLSWSWSWAQDDKTPAKKPSATVPTSTRPETKKPEAKPAPPGAGVTAIVGGDVYTVTREVIRRGTILIKDGKITAVGQDIPVPEGATVIDAKGKSITPGFITMTATNVAVRTLGGGGGPGGPPAPGMGGRTARFADALNPYDRNIKYCLGIGITAACVEVAAGGFGRFGRDVEDETSVCPCCGLTILSTEPITPPTPTERTPRRHAVIRMSFGQLDGMLVKDGPFYHLPAGAFATPLSRHQWRDQIRKAKQYLKDQANHEDDSSDGVPGAPPNRPVADEIIKLVEKKLALRTEASSAQQIKEMIDMAKELDYLLVLDEVHEGWLVANDLAQAKVPVVITPRSRRRPQLGREDTTGSTIELSGILEKAGVSFAVTPLSSAVSLDGIAGRDLTSLMLEAAFAIRGGASEASALASLTIAPAQMLGIADRVGSIEVGKDADLVIHSGPPLDYRTWVEKTLIGGKVFYDRSTDKLYPDTDQR